MTVWPEKKGYPEFVVEMNKRVSDTGSEADIKSSENGFSEGRKCASCRLSHISIERLLASEQETLDDEPKKRQESANSSH